VKRILVLGKDGQLASEFRRLSKRSSDFTFLDFLGREFLAPEKAASLRALIERLQPEFVINCAAYTAVDRAETEKELCFQANRDLPQRLAQASRDLGFHLVHYSTDYVFNGQGREPYIETDATDPVNTYGLSKLEGENEIRTHARSATILRTSWVYSMFGHNFVKTMLRLAAEGAKMRVVDDQIGCPTWAADIATWTLDHFLCRTESVDVFHFSGGGQTTWYAFAKKILEIKGINHEIVPVTTAEFPTPAKRPSYSVLSKSKIEKQTGVVVPEWDESLRRCLSDGEH
jgi:dTDP-4-dehydrorhamnose reductase